MPSRARILAGATAAGIICCLWPGVPAHEPAGHLHDEAVLTCEAGGGLPAGPGPAATCEAAPSSATPAAAGDPYGASAMRAFRDPATGRLVHREIALENLSAVERRMISRSTEGLIPRVLPGGAIALDLQGRFMNLSVARRNADGSLSARCIQGVDGRAGHAHAPPSAPAAPALEASDE